MTSVGEMRLQHRTGLKFRYMGKWEFIAQEHDEGQWIENYKRETSVIRRIMAKLLVLLF